LQTREKLPLITKMLAKSKGTMAKKLKQAANILVSISAWSTPLLALEKKVPNSLVRSAFPIVVTYTLLRFCHVSIFFAL